MASEPVKKSTPDPLPNAREQGIAPRALAPIARASLLGRLAIPIGLATGLMLTSAGVAVEIFANQDAGDAESSCHRADPDTKRIEHGVAPPIRTRPYIAPVQLPPNVAGGIGPIRPITAPPIKSVVNPPPPPIQPLPHPPRLGGAVAMPYKD